VLRPAAPFTDAVLLKRHKQVDDRFHELSRLLSAYESAGEVFDDTLGTPGRALKSYLRTAARTPDRAAAAVRETEDLSVRLHDLRHGAATLAHAAGADLKDIQEMLGHSSITFTADTYTKLLPRGGSGDRRGRGPARTARGRGGGGEGAGRC
jgi:integrase